MSRQEKQKRRGQRRKSVDRQTCELLKEWKLKISPQRQQLTKLSELTLEQHDQLLLFTLFTDDRALEKKVCEKLPILDIIESMGSVVLQEYKTNIKEVGKQNGSYAATKRFLTLATVKKLETGWSRQLLQTITSLKLKNVKKLISPKQADLDEFIKRIGIPRGSLLDKLTDQLRAHCGILISPMGKKDKDSERVPVVHPELCVSLDHFKTNTAFTDGTYKPSEEGRKAYEDAPRVSFNDVIKSNDQASMSTNKFSSVMKKHHSLFIFLIGTAGSGKTTVTKRMVKTWIQENKMAFLIPFAQIDKDERLSIKVLLTKFLCRLHNLEQDPSEEEIDEAFQWILDNQDKCLLMFDGLDQSSFAIPNERIRSPCIDDKFLPGDLVSLLMSRKFLPNCRLVLSSRPHSLAKLAPAVQPNIVVVVKDLLSNDVETLMDHYFERGTAREIMEKLRIKSPRIHQLIFTPLFLRLVAMLNNEVGEEVWTYVNTTAKLFFEVIDRLQTSAHHECGLNVDDVKILNLKLAEMAFYKTKQGSVVFEQRDLERYGLSGENVQDFLFGVMSSKQNTALLVGLMMVFYFNHQSTQEFFSARFAVEKLIFDDFKTFIETLFPRLEKNAYGELQVGEDFFANLRVLTIGCLNEINSRLFDGEEILQKKDFFIEYLSGYLRQLFVKHVSVKTTVFEDQKQIMADLLDFREERIINEIRHQLHDVNFSFNYGVSFPLNVGAHREGFFHFIRHFTSKIEQSELDTHQWTADEFRRLFQAIKQSSAKIEEMEVIMNPHDLGHVSDVAAVFPHLTKELKLMLKVPSTLYGDVDNRQEFCRKLKDEIEHFDSSKLKTKVLKVEVWDNYSSNCSTQRLILVIYLRRGNRPQLIKDIFV